MRTPDGMNWLKSKVLTGIWGAQAHVARMVLFARDCGPWQARDGVERACESGSREHLCHKCRKTNDLVRFRQRARVEILKIRAGFFRGPTVRFV